MSRTTILKISYLVALAVLAGVAGLIIWWLGGSTTVLIAVALLLLLPGRIQGIVYRDLFRGRRLLSAGQPNESLLASHQFLNQIRKRPWEKRLLWLSWSIYTVDAEAMVLNNIGAAHLECGDWDKSEEFLREALDKDPQYPIPFVNLAVIAELRGDRPKADDFLSEAASRGFRGSTIDQVIAAGQELLARLEGQGGQVHDPNKH